jgi:hypothetical protein
MATSRIVAINTADDIASPNGNLSLMKLPSEFLYLESEYRYNKLINSATP